MTAKEKVMPDVRDPAKWLDNCPECLCRNNPPHIVEIGTRPGVNTMPLPMPRMPRNVAHREVQWRSKRAAR